MLKNYINEYKIMKVTLKLNYLKLILPFQSKNRQEKII